MRSNRLFVVAAIACLAAASALTTAAERLVTAVRFGVYRLLAVVAEPFRPQVLAPGQEKPRVALVAGAAFVARVAKRRPAVHPSWRMCPSI